MIKDWRDTLKDGDIIYLRGKKTNPRIVRKVSYKNGFLTAVTMVIKNCSWTGRGTTTYNRTDLGWLGCTKARIRLKAKKLNKIDEEIQKNIIDHNLRTIT